MHRVHTQNLLKNSYFHSCIVFVKFRILTNVLILREQKNDKIVIFDIFHSLLVMLKCSNSLKKI